MPALKNPKKTPAAPGDSHSFPGFSKAAFDFLRSLKRNNDRDWFRDRKEKFEALVKEPMELLAQDVAASCRQRALPLYAKAKNPITRIYRDVRFSNDKTPFNTHLGAGLRTSPSSGSLGEVYIHITFDKPLVAAGFWMPERPFLQAWRESIAADPARMKRMAKQLQAKGLALGTEHKLTRLPRGFDHFADSDAAGFLRLTSYVTSRPLTEKDCSSPALIDTILDFAIAAKPLLEYGWKLGYKPPRDILDESPSFTAS